jgi:hypothetical protein
VFERLAASLRVCLFCTRCHLGNVKFYEVLALEILSFAKFGASVLLSKMLSFDKSCSPFMANRIASAISSFFKFRPQQYKVLLGFAHRALVQS